MVEILKNTTDGKAVRLIASDGESLDIAWGDFWNFYNEGKKMEVKSEVENYLEATEEVEGVDSNEIIADDELMDEIVQAIIEERESEDSGDELYDVIASHLPE